MHITQYPFLKFVCTPLIKLCEYIGIHYPETLVKIRYFVRFHKRLNLKDPQNLNEKILYLLLKTDTSLWTDLTDKYKVREYIKQCGLEDILVELYDVKEDASQIDFDRLPASFVLKTNHGSGGVWLVADKLKINKQFVVESINKSLNTKYGALEAGIHYYDIKPVVIVEELLENDEFSKQYSTSIIDYKVWCFNGQPYFIWTCCNRNQMTTDVMLYDSEWNAHPEYSIFTSGYRRGEIMPKPKNLDRMLHICQQLAKPFSCVRVDVYNIGGKIYFGEMTFTSLGGLMDFYTPDFLFLAGQLINLKR